MATFFTRPCPTCGRTLQIRVQYLGRNLACQHCSGRFIAHDLESETAAVDSPGDLLARAERLLDRSQATQLS